MTRGGAVLASCMRSVDSSARWLKSAASPASSMRTARTAISCRTLPAAVCQRGLLYRPGLDRLGEQFLVSATIAWSPQRVVCFIKRGGLRSRPSMSMRQNGRQEIESGTSVRTDS